MKKLIFAMIGVAFFLTGCEEDKALDSPAYAVVIDPDTVQVGSGRQIIESHPVVQPSINLDKIQWTVEMVEVEENGEIQRVVNSIHTERKEDKFHNPDDIEFKWAKIKTDRTTQTLTTEIEANPDANARELRILVDAPICGFGILHVMQAGNPKE